MARRNRLSVKVRGVGRVRVTRMPKLIPKTVTVGGKRYPITKQNYLEAWALAGDDPKKLHRFLAERVTVPEPKVKLTSEQKFKQEVEFGIGRDVGMGEISGLYERGLTAEQVVSSLRAEARKREKEEKKERKIMV